MSRPLTIAVFTCAAVLGALAPVYAQDAPAQPVAGVETTDIETHGDWTVRCFKVQASPAPCDMSQIVLDDNSKKRLMQISLGYAPGADAYATQIIVPLGVSLSQGLTLSVGDYRAANIRFRRCMPDGCYVEAQIETDAIKAMTSNQAATVTVIGWGDAHVFDLPLSLKGFVEAHDAMVKLNRAKAAAAPVPSNP